MGSCPPCRRIRRGFAPPAPAPPRRRRGTVSLADARRQAEEALAKYEEIGPAKMALYPVMLIRADIVRALLAATAPDPQPEAKAKETWPERYARERMVRLGDPKDWPPCSGGDWIETMVHRPGWVCGACGHEPSHPRHAAASAPAPPAGEPQSYDDGYQVPPINCGTFADVIPAPPAGDGVREAAERLLEDYVGVEDMLPPETAAKVIRLRSALDAAKGGAR